MINSSQKMYLVLTVILSTPLLAMESGVAVISRPPQEQTTVQISYTELLKREKELFLRMRAEFEQSKRTAIGSADIDAEEIDMMHLEASELKKLEERGFVLYQEGSDRHGWLIRAFDRQNRYKKWLKKQEGQGPVVSTGEPKEVALQIQESLPVDEIMKIEKTFSLKQRAEFEQGTRTPYGRADIDADEIEMMNLENTEITRLLKQGFAFIQKGSEYEGWLIRAFDRRNRYKNWLEKQEEIIEL